MTRINVNADQFPLVVVTLPESASDDDVAAYLEELRALRARRVDYALIVNATASRGFSAKQRQMQADYVEEGIEISRRHLKAFAFVAESAFQRGMLTAIFWLRKPEWPHAVFSSLLDARVWCRERLALATSREQDTGLRGGRT
jgi:hypothetical protein